MDRDSGSEREQRLERQWRYISYFLPCCDRNTWPKQLQEGRFVLAHGLGVLSTVLGNAAGAGGRWPRCTCVSESTGVNALAKLNLPFVPGPGSWPGNGPAFDGGPSLSYLNLDTPSQTCPEACSHGDYKSHQVTIRINNYKGKVSQAW